VKGKSLVGVEIYRCLFVCVIHTSDIHLQNDDDDEDGEYDEDADGDYDPKKVV